MSNRRISSRFFVFAASSSMIRQYGHAVATAFARVSSTWLRRRWFTFSPTGSSIHIRAPPAPRSEEHTSELQSRPHLVCRLLLEKKKDESRRIEDRRRRSDVSAPADE